MAKKMKDIRRKLLNHQLKIDDLMSEQADFISFADRAINRTVSPEELEEFLRLCLDVYAYSDSGKVLIPDRTYDMCMNIWKSLGNDAIIYPDDILDSGKWNLRPHPIPGLVGTISNKLYSYDELKLYCKNNASTYDITGYVIAPKYDGISVAIEVRDEMIVLALTRYTGEMGQDITAVIKMASNAMNFLDIGQNRHIGLSDGYYKCEVLVDTEHFEELVKIKPYANRRSATSGIINTPKNIDFGCYLTIIPLIYYNPGDDPKYIAPYSINHVYTHPRDMMDAIEDRLSFIRSSSFPYRVDGVVCYPIEATKRIKYTENDMMRGSMAYKVNTAEAKTTIEFVYMSVGRLGGATPMARVKPVEVNETIVHDVSLGSYERFMSLNLYEGEEVIIFSAGDVIPQLKKTDYANNVYDKPYLKMKKVCPYCGEKLTRISTEYRCDNPDCIRVSSGRITNFAVKMGMQGFSDEAFSDFYSAGIIKSIPDVFKVTSEDIASLEGYSKVSGDNFINEVERIKSQPVHISTLFGALGIPNISKKKCQKIFEMITLKDLLKSDASSVVLAAIGADGIGIPTAEIFANFIDKNRKDIKELTQYLQLVDDAKYKGNVVFTGFTSKEWSDKFKEIGYDTGDSVTSKTVALVSATSDYNSTKCKNALKKGVSIYLYSDIEELYEALR